MPRKADRPQAEILDFEAAFLNASPPAERDEVVSEARLLAEAFAPEGAEDELLAMADALSAGDRHQDMARARARKVAAALRSMARGETFQEAPETPEEQSAQPL